MPRGPAPDTLHILLVDDHLLVSEGLSLMTQVLAQRVVVALGESYADARAQLLGGRFDLVLLDYFLPDRTGDADLTEVVRLAAATPVVVISAEHDAALVTRAFRCGARGFIPKRSPAEVMLAALRLVLSGGTYVPPELIATTSPREPGPILTPRQHDVLQLLVDGRSNKEIASHLGTSVSTVRVHLTGIFRALNAENRAQACTIAMRDRLVRPR